MKKKEKEKEEGEDGMEVKGEKGPAVAERERFGTEREKDLIETKTNGSYR